MVAKLKLLPALLGAMLAGTGALAQQAADPSGGARSSEVGIISISGDGDKLGTGLIVQEDSPKARSSVARSSIDKVRATANPFQLIELLPGVHTFSHDASGLFSGGLTMRGFNSDQIGFTVNGAPLNDSGNFSFFPQQYMDQENLCQVFLTQGSTDTDAPHVGASGGNLGIVTCDPRDERRVRVGQTIGEDSLRKTFLRADSGKLLDDRFTGFVSISKASVDKWKGEGQADRLHVDVGAKLSLGGGSQLAFSGLYNNALNNNFKTLSKEQYNAFGRNFDFLDSFSAHPTPVNGTAQTEVFANSTGAGPVTPQNNAYYGLSLNPVRNVLYTLKGNFQLRPDLRLDVEPYFWYVVATGGTQQRVLREDSFFNPATGANNGKRDINGDGDTLDSVIVYSRALTETHRPGATVKLDYQGDNHRLLLGYWFERARHRQTSPATRVDNAGNPADPWLVQNLILRPDESLYQGRDQFTLSTTNEIFVQDSINLLNDRLNLTLGVRRPRLNRDFRNYANEGGGIDGFNAGKDYRVDQTFSATLPSFGLRYQLNSDSHMFFNVTKNFRAPINAVYQNLINSAGQLVVPDVKPETAINTDLGYRYQGADFTFSGALFNVDLRDRQAPLFDPVVNSVVAGNVGRVTMRGVELEAGTRPFGGWSAYASYSHTASRIADDLRNGAASVLPTAGKEFPNTPKNLFGASLQYASGPFYAQLQAKYTGRVYSTLTNDEDISGFTVVNLNLGYRLPDAWLLKNQTVRVNVSNLFDRQYLSLSGGSGDAIVSNATGANAGVPLYYVGAPRFISLSYSLDF